MTQTLLWNLPDWHWWCVYYYSDDGQLILNILFWGELLPRLWQHVSARAVNEPTRLLFWWGGWMTGGSDYSLLLNWLFNVLTPAVLLNFYAYSPYSGVGAGWPVFIWWWIRLPVTIELRYLFPARLNVIYPHYLLRYWISLGGGKVTYIILFLIVIIVDPLMTLDWFISCHGRYLYVPLDTGILDDSTII